MAAPSNIPMVRRPQPGPRRHRVRRCTRVPSGPPARPSALPAATCVLSLLLVLALPGPVVGNSPHSGSISEVRGLQAPSPPVDTLPQRNDRPVLALPAGSPLIARGAILFGVGGTHTTVRNLHLGGQLRPLGEEHFSQRLGVQELPELQDAETRFRELLGPGSNWSLNLGSVGGRFQVQEQHVPLSLGYGVLDRLTVGVTIPLVRRRIDSTVRFAGHDATAGTNPSATDPAQVSGFLTAALQALADLQNRVETVCDPDPEPDPAAVDPSRCHDGQELLEQTAGFLDLLESAYQNELVFPLRGTEGAFRLLDRWVAFRNDLADWNVSAPGEIPLARSPLGDQAFASSFVDPLWGPDGFPRDRAEEFMEMGDVEFHAVLGILDTALADRALRVRTSVVGTLRLGTGEPDSLQALAPVGPPRGVGGMGVRVVADIVSARRVGLLSVAELWQFQETETALLAPDPARFFGAEGLNRLPVGWTPGATLRMGLTPRFHLMPGISLGLGYHLERRNAASFTPRTGGDAATGFLQALEGSSTLQRLRGELRYHGLDSPVLEALPFALDLVLSYEEPIRGSGTLATAERRVRMGARFLRGGR